MINIRTAVLHNGVDASAEYARQVAEQITDECAVVDAYTNAPLRHVLPLRAVPNVMVCLFCDGLEEYQEVAAIINQLNQIKSADFTTATFVEQAEKGNVDEETARQHTELFEAWAVDTVYEVGAMRQYEGNLYKCLQSHTSQENWTPDATPALWVEVAAPNEYREIKDGMLPTEAFALGEIGWYKTEDNLWKSLIDANTYTPETYPAGWEQVTG